MTSRQLRAGFTVVELLIALLLLSTLSMMSYRGLTAVLATRAQVAAETAKWQRVSAFLQRFQRDIALASPRPARELANTRPAWHSPPDQLDQPLLTFSRFAQNHQGDRPRRLAYTLSQQRVLELWLWPGVDLTGDHAPVRYPLLHNIREFELRFLDAQQIWQAHWPNDAELHRLPKAVRLRLVLGSGETVERIFGVGT